MKNTNKTKAQLIQELEKLQGQVDKVDDSEAPSATRVSRNIANRLHGQEELRLQAKMLEVSANHIVVTDRDGNITWVNKAFTTITGYSAEEVIGENPSMLNSGTHPKEFYEDLWQTILAGNVWHGEMVNKRKDGSLCPEELTITPIQDDNGEISHFIAIKQDITERKLAEEETKQRNNDLTTLNTISTAISQSITLDDILKIALTEIVVATGVDGAECHLPENNRELSLRMTHELDETFSQDSKDFRFPIHEGIPGLTFENREPVYVRNAQTDKRFLRKKLAKAAGYKSLLCVPILTKDQLLGTFMLYSLESREFSPELRDLMMTVGGQLASAIINARLFDHQQQLANIVTHSKDGIASTTLDGIFLSWNRGMERLFGYKAEEVIGKPLQDIVPEEKKEESRKLFENSAKGEAVTIQETTRIHKDGSLIDVAITLSPMYNDLGEINSLIGIVRDISKEKQILDELRSSEERFRTLFNGSTDAILVSDLKTKKFVEVNDIACERLGYTRDELINLNPVELSVAENSPNAPFFNKAAMQKFLDEKKAVFESAHITKQGSKIPVEINSHIFSLEGREVILSIARDITDRKEAEARLQQLANIVEFSNDAIISTSAKGDILSWNPGAQRMFGYSSDGIIGKKLEKLTPKDQQTKAKVILNRVLNGEHITNFETTRINREGQRLYVSMTLSPMINDLGHVTAIAGVIRDVTGKKLIDKALRESEERYRLLFHSSGDLVFVHGFSKDGKPGSFNQINDVACDLLGYDRRELLNMTVQDIAVGQPNNTNHRKDLMKNKHALFEWTFETNHGERIPVEINAHLFDMDGTPTVLSIARDITERKQTEARMRQLANIVDYSNDAITSTTPEGVMLSWNPGAEQLFGYKAKEILGRKLTALVPERKKTEARKLLERVMQGEDIVNFETVRLNNNGEEIDISLTLSAMLDENGKPFAIAGISRDVTEQKMARQALKESEERYRLLFNQSADLVFVNSFDPKGRTSKFIEVNDIAKTKLGYDSREFLNITMHDIAVGVPNKVDHGKELKKNNHALIEGVIASKDGREFDVEINSHVFSINESPTILSIARDITERKQAEQQLKSLNENLELRVQNRTQELENANHELELSYEATLEGWVRALDMRDNATQGHTQRVTEMTIQLAECYGIDSSQIPHLRRGALLHDIGKIAIPDEILLKPGPLTEKEWKIMRRHPEHAYNFLAPIDYLAGSIDIPRYHHENWDGSGYPHGLKGKKIPIAARLFTIVDVWDALLSDRPYRAAWPQQEAMDYIRGQSGKKFDPKVTKVFIEDCIARFI